ncbi:MAG TPA: thioredoxin domain-containing protein [Mucilaginibacter sp.]|jgi:rhodanese-related sulfurtransferase|nr:thioredoxin domain-containing protein [Mucilaginibacter sp.]
MKKLNSIACIMLIVLATQVKAQQNQVKLSIDSIEEKINHSAQPQIIDARSAEEFAINHLKNAINLNIDPSKSALQLNAFNKQQPVFVYAIGNYRSGLLAKKLRTQGFSQVYELPGGISNWIGSGKPVETAGNGGLLWADFNTLIGKEKLVLIDFGSKYCPGCVKMSPVIDSVKAETNVKVIRIELYDNTTLANQLKIRVWPTIALYKDGNLIWKKDGQIPKDEIINEVKTGAALSSSK